MNRLWTFTPQKAAWPFRDFLSSCMTLLPELRGKFKPPQDFCDCVHLCGFIYYNHLFRRRLLLMLCCCLYGVDRLQYSSCLKEERASTNLVHLGVLLLSPNKRSADGCWLFVAIGLTSSLIWHNCRYAWMFSSFRYLQKVRNDGWCWILLHIECYCFLLWYLLPLNVNLNLNEYKLFIAVLCIIAI